MADAVFPRWYFNSDDAAKRSAAVDEAFAAMGAGNKAAYLEALAKFQAATGGLKTCPASLAACPWNPPGTDPALMQVGTDARGFYTMGGKRLPVMGGDGPVLILDEPPYIQKAPPET